MLEKFEKKTKTFRHSTTLSTFRGGGGGGGRGNVGREARCQTTMSRNTFFFAFLIIVKNFSEKSCLLRLIISDENIIFQNQNLGSMGENICCFIKD